jgi:hypothetical protein
MSGPICYAESDKRDLPDALVSDNQLWPLQVYVRNLKR